MKYPRTPHLLNSHGGTRGDTVVGKQFLSGVEFVVVTEKMDGECTSISATKIHARSENSRDHVSRHWVKALHAKIQNQIPKGVTIFGENMYAKHSIHYTALPSYFLMFAIMFDNEFLAWNEVEKVAGLLGLKTVPILFKGKKTDYEKRPIDIFFYSGQSLCGGDQEGFVVRNANEFKMEDFANNVGKFVRPNHVQTTHNWMRQPIIKNKMA